MAFSVQEGGATPGLISQEGVEPRYQALWGMYRSQFNQESPRELPLHVVTDMDGTLMDGQYSYHEAFPALESCMEAGVPVTLCTSKTTEEVVELLNSQDNKDTKLLRAVVDAFIAESGGEIVVRDEEGKWKSTPLAAGIEVANKVWWEIVQNGSTDLGKLKTITPVDIHSENGTMPFLSLEEFMKITGLSSENARRAQNRKYQQGVHLGKLDKETKAQITQEIQHRAAVMAQQKGQSITVVDGGKFLQIIVGSDKGTATRVVNSLFSEPPISLGLGDAASDTPMLENCTMGVRLEHTAETVLRNTDRLTVITGSTGPAEWNEAVFLFLRAAGKI